MNSDLVVGVVITDLFCNQAIPFIDIYTIVIVLSLCRPVILESDFGSYFSIHCFFILYFHTRSANLKKLIVHDYCMYLSSMYLLQNICKDTKLHFIYELV